MAFNEILITNEINDSQKIAVCKLFYRAFSPKLNNLWLFNKNESQVVEVLLSSIKFENGFYALKDGNLLGFIGLEEHNNYFHDYSLSLLQSKFGKSAGYRAYYAYKLTRFFSRKQAEDIIHIDPLAVHEDYRSMGIGTILLEKAYEKARLHGKKKITLEVINTNKRARKLYEREGFKAKKINYYGLLTIRAGFTSMVYMIKTL